MAINMYLNTNHCPVSVQTDENKTWNTLNQTIDGEPFYVRVTNSVTEVKLLPFSDPNVRIYNFLQKFAAHLKPCGSTPVAQR
jgi:hypothetical protein